jgi:hypothetical protein
MRPQKEASLMVGTAALKISPSLPSVTPTTLAYISQLNGLFASILSLFTCTEWLCDWRGILELGWRGKRNSLREK